MGCSTLFCLFTEKHNNKGGSPDQTWYFTFDTTKQSSYVNTFLDISGEYSAEETNKFTAEGTDRDDSVACGHIQY